MKVEKWQWIVFEKNGEHAMTHYFFTEEKAADMAEKTGDKAVKAEWTRIVVDV